MEPCLSTWSDPKYSTEIHLRWSSLRNFWVPVVQSRLCRFTNLWVSEKKKYMEEVRCETSWVCTTLTSVAGWDTLWHSALKHSCSCVEDQLPEWQLRRFCRATLTTATKTLWSLLLPCYYYSNLYNVLLAIINYDLFTISIYTKISEGHLML